MKTGDMNCAKCIKYKDQIIFSKGRRDKIKLKNFKKNQKRKKDGETFFIK